MRVIGSRKEMEELAKTTIELYRTAGYLPEDFVRSTKEIVKRTYKSLNVLFYQLLLQNETGREILKKYFFDANE